jgi:peptide/nickel transport system permease protein
MRTLAGKLFSLIATLLLAGFLGGLLVRLAPGWDVDERELDTRLSEESLRALRIANGASDAPLAWAASYLRRLATGDLGVSRASQRPVGQILAERAPLTLRSAGLGYLLAWGAGLLLALALSDRRAPVLETLCAATTGLLLSVPAACIGFLALWWGIGLEWAVAAALFPKVFRFSIRLLRTTHQQPHVLLAMAKGLSRARILLVHVLRPSLNELAALAGATTGLAFGAAIPLEVVCDSPGLGQLAWQAATARDLPVLVAITLLATAIVKTSDLCAELLRSGLRENRA